MSFSEILNILLGGGLVALVVAVATMKATVRKANADAERAKADAETVLITNTENATRVLVENIVKPLKEELNATRTDLQATKKEMASTKREMARLRKAVEAATSCPHYDGCPVVLKLRGNQRDPDGSEGELLGIREERHDLGRDKAYHNRDDPGEPGESGSVRRQPP